MPVYKCSIRFTMFQVCHYILTYPLHIILIGNYNPTSLVQSSNLFTGFFKVGSFTTAFQINRNCPFFLIEPYNITVITGISFQLFNWYSLQFKTLVHASDGGNRQKISDPLFCYSCLTFHQYTCFYCLNANSCIN